MESICLQITVNSASDLHNPRNFGPLKPYVVVFISSNPNAQQKTPVDETGETNPAWNSTMNFSISTFELQQQHQNHNLVFQLNCQRSFGGDKLIGNVNVPIKDIFAKAPSMFGSAQFASYPVIKPNNTAKGLLHFSYKFQELLSASGSIPMLSVPQQKGSGIGLAGSDSTSCRPQQGSGIGTPVYVHPAAAQLNSAASYRPQFMMQHQGSGTGLGSSGIGKPNPQQNSSQWIPKTGLAIGASSLAVGVGSFAVNAVSLDNQGGGGSGGGASGGENNMENPNMGWDPTVAFGLQDGTGYEMYDSLYGNDQSVMVDQAAFVGDPVLVDQSLVPDASSSVFVPDTSSVHVPDVSGFF